jgi:hypothetical protein
MEPVMNLLDNPKLQAIRHNPELLKQIWNAVESNLEDARTYLTTGRSPRFDAIKILGRWRFDSNAAMNAIRRSKPNISSLEMQRLRKLLESTFGKTELIAKPDNQATLKNAPSLKFSPNSPAAALAAITTPSVQTVQGQWKDANAKYLVEFSGQDLPTTIDGDRLTMKNEGLDWVFARED